MIPCPTCHQSVSPNADACPHCGEPIGRMKQANDGLRLICVVWALLYTVPACLGVMGAVLLVTDHPKDDLWKFLLICSTLALLIGWLPYIMWKGRLPRVPVAPSAPQPPAPPAPQPAAPSVKITTTRRP